MRSWNCSLVAALLLGIGWLPLAQARVLVYQPLNQDVSVSSAQWEQLWRTAVGQGYERLLVQWTRHDDSDFGDVDGWLNDSLRLAEAEGLGLILGLHYDSDYYPVLDRGDSDAYFWHHALSLGLDQVLALKEWELSVQGWYLPFELDDWYYRQRDLQQELLVQLGHLVQLPELDGLPLHISAFAAGQLTPAQYGKWLHELSALPLTIWWQDGEGTSLLPEAAQLAYREQLLCDMGVIYEAFEQHSATSEAFSARPRTDFALPEVSDCHPQAVFSLRYLPWAAGVLELP